MHTDVSVASRHAQTPLPHSPNHPRSSMVRSREVRLVCPTSYVSSLRSLLLDPYIHVSYRRHLIHIRPRVAAQPSRQQTTTRVSKFDVEEGLGTADASRAACGLGLTGSMSDKSAYRNAAAQSDDRGAAGSSRGRAKACFVVLPQLWSRPLRRTRAAGSASTWPIICLPPGLLVDHAVTPDLNITGSWLSQRGSWLSQSMQRKPPAIAVTRTTPGPRSWVCTYRR
ncbi:hypothetical protein C8T65DRAFT_114237 [Cerioporus squamosus]|nr:hypothetical protein C8T65DRAFT_114237 [Cerioporus squamosus]